MAIKQSFPRCLIAAAAVLLPFAGCSQKSDHQSDKSTSIAPGNDTLAAELAKDGDLSTLNQALRDTGLRDVFDNGASYTIFAPTDDAFGKLSGGGKELLQQDRRAVLAAVLRDHIVPGYLTPDDIGSAIDSEGGRVKVRTMGDHMLSFARDGDGFRVTAEDGSTARIAGEPVTASDGVAIPVDGVLKKV